MALPAPTGELKYEDAVANLGKAGLAPDAYNSAKSALDNHYGVPTGPTTQPVPGVGTMTITPKNIPVAPPAPPAPTPPSVYERSGLTPPPAPSEISYADAVKNLETGGLKGGALDAARAALKTHYGPSATDTPNGFQPPKVDGLPTYPVDTPQGRISDAYEKTLNTINELEKNITSSATPSEEEKQLRDQLLEYKAKLARFDVASLQASEDLRGQGRGATLGTINTRDTVIARTRAIERLGMAAEAGVIADLLTATQDDRKNMGAVAKTQYDLATKKLDIALGIEDKISSLNDKEQSKARQYLLDVVNFSAGKAYNELDADTQAAITHAVANSPITLDMVKTALKSAADKAAADARGDLRSVAGLGVVQIDPITGKYRVVVPENPNDHSGGGNSGGGSTPTVSFNQYLEQQNIPLPSLTPQKMESLRAEYDTKYGSGQTVNLGKLNATNKNDLSQAGLSGAPSAVQSYFLNAPTQFRDQYQRDYAAGKVSKTPTLAELNDKYTAWLSTQKKSTGSSTKVDALYKAFGITQ